MSATSKPCKPCKAWEVIGRAAIAGRAAGSGPVRSPSGMRRPGGAGSPDGEQARPPCSPGRGSRLRTWANQALGAPARSHQPAGLAAGRGVTVAANTRHKPVTGAGRLPILPCWTKGSTRLRVPMGWSSIAAIAEATPSDGSALEPSPRSARARSSTRRAASAGLETPIRAATRSAAESGSVAAAPTARAPASPPAGPAGPSTPAGPSAPEAPAPARPGRSTRHRVWVGPSRCL
jgi:hypothetical protein